LPGSRTSAVTASPRASTLRTISLPTRPVAPITAVAIVSPLGKLDQLRRQPHLLATGLLSRGQPVASG
jgi:hypothetical protein